MAKLRGSFQKVHSMMIYGSGLFFVRSAWFVVFLLSDVPETIANSSSHADIKCRTESGVNLPFDVFRIDTCARCYFYLPPWAFNDDAKLSYNPRLGLLYNQQTNESFAADPDNPTSPIYNTFQSEVFARKWIACCRAAIDCCGKMSTDPPYIDDGSTYCPRTWDGWQCWSDTKSGETAKNTCEDHVYFMSEPPPCPRYAVKTCWNNGTWFVNQWNSEWTNYSGCGRVGDMRRLLNFHIATYAISIAFLLPALLIFSTYKQLQVHRISMHKNLFTSLLLNGVTNIIFKTVVILDELDNSSNRRTIMEQNGAMCKSFCLLTKYTRMTSYMWMFCEGFYLHKLIAAAFAEQKSLTMFYIIGWVFPVFPVATFALLRWYYADEQCWAIPVKPYEWITNSPNLLSLVLNLIFLCNIIRVLVTKLRAAHANEPSQFRKAVRATLVLVPLFGLHFFLFIYKPQSGECSFLEGYMFFNYAMDGLQGFLVSLIFCYLNGEITELLRRSTYRFRLRYSLNVQPTSLTQVSNMSDISTGLTRSRYSIEANMSNTSRRWRRSTKDQAADDEHFDLQAMQSSLIQNKNSTNERHDMTEM